MYPDVDVTQRPQSGDIVDFRAMVDRLDAIEAKVDRLVGVAELAETLAGVLQEFRPLLEEGRRRMERRDRGLAFMRGDRNAGR